MDGSFLAEKSSFKMLGLTFSSKLDWGSYIIFIAKTAYIKIGALIRSMKFLSPEVALFLSKSSFYLELLDKLQKKMCMTVGPLIAAALEPLTYCQNMAN